VGKGQREKSRGNLVAEEGANVCAGDRENPCRTKSTVGKVAKAAKGSLDSAPERENKAGSQLYRIMS